MSTNSPDIIGLSEIEKKIKNFQYPSIHAFSYEVRKLWKHYFLLGSSTSIELYQKTIEISKIFEDAFEIEENPNENSNFDYLNKKIQKLESQFNNTEKLKQTGGVVVGNSNIQKQPIRQQVPLHEKPMTITEKNILGNNIRQLNQDQMKGIISIVSDQFSLDKCSKYFEFDIDKLSTRKLRELEKYVKKCFKSRTSGGGASVSINQGSSGNNRQNKDVLAKVRI